ncbi:MAG: class I SAM-dependent methyltransferase [Thermoanaerobaculia bacterium]
MARWRKKRQPVKVSTSLRLMREVLELDHLHYGLWQGEPLDLAGLKKAQERYADKLCDWVPAGVRTILDVGCGTGSMALRLRARGFEVEGLAPDPYLGEVFTERTGLPFHLARFQDFEPERRYDLILMSESAQYIWLDSLFPHVCRVAPGGHLLLADYFVVENDGSMAARSGHPLEAFLERASRCGCELVRREDVTEQTAPTLALASRWLDRYGVKIAEVLAERAERRNPWLYRLGDKLFGGRIRRRLEQERTLCDPRVFRRLKRYELMLLQVP